MSLAVKGLISGNMSFSVPSLGTRPRPVAIHSSKMATE